MTYRVFVVTGARALWLELVRALVGVGADVAVLGRSVACTSLCWMS